MSKIIGWQWTRTKDKPIQLECEAKHDNGAITMTGMREEHMIEIAEWCKANKCGVRTFYNHFQFKNEKQVTMFLLRWA